MRKFLTFINFSLSELLLWGSGGMVQIINVDQKILMTILK